MVESPTAEMPPMMTITIKEAINPYSIAVEPTGSFRNLTSNCISIDGIEPQLANYRNEM
jgi:hypothetical protein